MVVTLVAVGLVMLAIATLIGTMAARAGYPLPEGKRAGCIDGLRGYLALSVMIYHFGLWMLVARYGRVWSRPDSALLDGLGPGSVNLFFMVTGLVFYPRILDGLTRTRWPAVYISRFFRIVPLVALSLIVICATILIRLRFHPLAPGLETAGAALNWLTSHAQPDLFGYPNSASLNAAVLWSLRYEWLFYLLILPTTAGAMDVAKRLRLPTAVVPIGLMMCGLALPLLVKTPAIVTYLPMFGSGMLAFEVAHSRVGKTLRSPSMSVPLAFLLVGGLLAGHGLGPIRFACHTVFFAGIASGNSMFGLFTSRGARVLGEGSYAIYLLHGYFLNLLFVDFAPLIALGPPLAPIGLLPPMGILVVIVALLSFRYFEAPMIALGRHVTERITVGRQVKDAPMLDVTP